MAKLTIIRGLPGSGKSTLAQKMALENEVDIWENDMYFTKDGVYKFDKDKFQDAVDWCFNNVFTSLESGHDTIVSNCFLRKISLLAYIEECQYRKIPYEVITCRGEYGSTHAVPPETLESMKGNWEEYDCG